MKYSTLEISNIMNNAVDQCSEDLATYIVGHDNIIWGDLTFTLDLCAITYVNAYSLQSFANQLNTIHGICGNLSIMFVMFLFIDVF